MSSATMLRSSTFRPSTTVQARRASQPRRVGRVALKTVAVTNWQLEPKGGKGQFVDLTESIADKATASVKSSGGDFTLKGLESTDLQLEFRSEGAGQKADSPADLFIKDTGSNVEISLDGKKLEKNKEYQISVGQELKIGDDATYQIIRDTRAHA